MKTIIFEIVGSIPPNPIEYIDEFKSRDEAEAMLAEYKIAFGPQYSLDIVEKQVDHDYNPESPNLPAIFENEVFLK